MTIHSILLPIYKHQYHYQCNCRYRIETKLHGTIRHRIYTNVPNIQYTHEIGKKPIMKHLPKEIVTCKWRLLYSTAVNMKCQILIGCVYMCIHHIFVDNWFTGPVCSHNEHVQYIVFLFRNFSVSALFIGAKRCMKNDFIYWNFSQK